VPMLDIYVPEGALQPEAEAALLGRLTDILIKYEGFDPADPTTREVFWAFLYRPVVVHVGGVPADAPRYKIAATVPEGQLDRADRESVVAEVTEAVLDAEQGTWPRDVHRVWVFPTEIPDGYWGGRGHITPLSDILQRLTRGDLDQARELAARRITGSRIERAHIPAAPAPPDPSCDATVAEVRRLLWSSRSHWPGPRPS
jgi:phenylpyruvate tautomerase PptA (4-oxalocrotonate tautomerase family)